MNRATAVLGTFVITIVLASGAALWLMFDQPTIERADGTSYTCHGAYYAVVVDDGYRGGELPPDQDELDATCLDLGERRLWLAAIPGGLTVLLALPTAILIRRAHRRAMKPA